MAGSGLMGGPEPAGHGSGAGSRAAGCGERSRWPWETCPARAEGGPPAEGEACVPARPDRKGAVEVPASGRQGKNPAFSHHGPALDPFAPGPPAAFPSAGGPLARITHPGAPTAARPHGGPGGAAAQRPPETDSAPGGKGTGQAGAERNGSGARTGPAVPAAPGSARVPSRDAAAVASREPTGSAPHRPGWERAHTGHSHDRLRPVPARPVLCVDIRVSS